MEPLDIFQIDESSGVPIWIQIRKRLIYLIGSGHFKSSERLPSVREMSVRFGVNYNTINKVYQDLERDDIFTRNAGLARMLLRGCPSPLRSTMILPPWQTSCLVGRSKRECL